MILRKKTGFKRLFYAFVYSFAGFQAAIRHEVAFRQALIGFTFLSAGSFFLPITMTEHVLILASLGLVLIVELFNSAIECISDRITTKPDPLIKRAKDYGSLATLISLFIAAGFWFAILTAKSGSLL